MRSLFFVLVMLISSGNSWADPQYKQQAESTERSSDSVKTTQSAKPTENDKKASLASPVTENGATGEDKKQSVTFKSLAQLDELIVLGVPALALSLLEDEQNKRQQFSAEWYAFEYKRIVVLLSLERWQQVIDRSQWIFDTAIAERQITKRIRLWFETQQVIARLQLKQSEVALEQLQRLLWQSNAKDRDPSLSVIWRRLLIRAYLQ